MPLFMFISGFVSFKENYEWSSVKKRFFQLIIPFMAWAMLGMTISGNYNWIWLTKPDTALWFLWVLFWIGCAHIGISKLGKRLNISDEIIMVIATIVFLCLLLISKFSFGFHLFAWYLPFYFAGVITRKYSIILDRLDKFKWTFLLTFVVLGFFWMRKESPTFMHSNSMSTIYSYKIIVGFIGCYTFILIARLHNHKLLYISELGGVMTLGIYAIHQLVIKYLVSFNTLFNYSLPLWLYVCLVFLLTLGITLILYKILSHIKFLSRLFLGK